MITFFKKAFADMKASAKAQHEVDRLRFQAVKAESRANFEEAKAMGKPARHRKAMEEKHAEQMAQANERIARANARIAQKN